MPKVRRTLRCKNIVIDQRKLDAAKAALGTPTETATVDAALELIAFRTEVFRGLDELAALGGIESVRRARTHGEKRARC